MAFYVENFDEVILRFDCEPVREISGGVRFTFTKDTDGVPIKFRKIR